VTRLDGCENKNAEIELLSQALKYATLSWRAMYSSHGAASVIETTTFDRRNAIFSLPAHITPFVVPDKAGHDQLFDRYLWSLESLLHPRKHSGTEDSITAVILN
jgi:hypothetical protein